MTQPAGQDNQADKTSKQTAVPSRPYAGSARKQTDRWYARAGRRFKRGARRVAMPVLFAAGICVATAAAFELGRHYQHYIYAADSLEQKVFYKKDEITVTKKDGVLHYKRKVELEQIINPNMLKPQLLQQYKSPPGKRYTEL